jgi:hypothetical protein
MASALASSRAGAAGNPCLSGQVGEILSAKLAAHEFDGALPPGWRLEEVEVARDHIDLGVLDDQRQRRGVALRPGIGGSADGHGRSFAFVIDAGGVPLDEAGRRGLLELATRVDAAVPAAEASRECDAHTRKSSDAGWHGERGRELPPWIPLLAGGLEGLVLLALLFRHRAQPAGVASADASLPPLRPLHYALLAGALALFVVSAVPAIPYDFCDLCYFFSLEDGQWGPQEWMHPLWVPFLAGYRALLGVFGFHGHMLVPVEVLNVGIAVAALVLIFSLARRVTGDALLAVAAILTTAPCNGFWSAAVRPTPYAFAFLCLTASTALLVSDKPVPPRRYAVAGAFAGLAMGLHASAMALAPVALLCAVREPDPDRTRGATVRRVAAFGAGMIASAAVCWGLFVARNHITLDYFQKNSIATTFDGIEQVPGSSIYSSHSPLRQVTELVGTLGKRNTTLWYVGLPLFVLLLLTAFRRAELPWRNASDIERRLATAALATFAVVGAFFLINNTHNGFVFASLALVPTLFAVLASRLRFGRPVFLAAALMPVIGLSSMASLGLGGARGDHDPLLVEVQYLRKQIGPKDVMLTPGCPFAEMQYAAPMNFIELRDDGAEDTTCQAPHACIDGTLHDRVDWWTANGGRVWLAMGDETTDFAGNNDTGADNPNGAEKARQIYWDPRLRVSERARHLAEMRAALDAAGLSLGTVITSPGGKRYSEVLSRKSDRAITKPPPAPFSTSELESAIGERNIMGSWRVRVLDEMAAALPEDPWAACDRMQLACETGARRGDDSLCKPLPGCNLCGPGRDASLTRSGPSPDGVDPPAR